jgi:hypothetical protein
MNRRFIAFVVRKAPTFGDETHYNINNHYLARQYSVIYKRGRQPFDTGILFSIRNRAHEACDSKTDAEPG